MTKSQHGTWMTVVDGKQRIFRQNGGRYDILEFQRYPYTVTQTDKVSNLIRSNLTDDLISEEMLHHLGLDFGEVLGAKTESCRGSD